MNIKVYWEHLVTREKALWKSATVYVAAVIAALPDILSFAQSNFSTLADYLPKALQDPVMHWIGLFVFLARMRSLIKLPPVSLPPPAPEATR